MSRSRATGLVAVLAVLVLLSGCGGNAGGAKSAASTRLPDVTLTSLRPGDRSIDLGSLKGPAVVNLWANWCKPCRKEMPIYERFHRDHGDVRVIGVNALDTQRDRARAVAREAGVTYPLVVDPDQRIKAIGLPKLLLVDRTGKVVYTEYVQIKSVAQLDRLVAQHLKVGS